MTNYFVRSIVALIRNGSVTTNHYITGSHARFDYRVNGRNSAKAVTVLCCDFVTHAIHDSGVSLDQEEPQEYEQSNQYQTPKKIDFKSIQEMQLQNFSPKRLVRYYQDYSALEEFVTQWRKDQEEILKQSPAASDSSLNSSNRQFIFPSTPIPTSEHLRNFLEGERALIRRDALLHGYDTVEVRVQALNRLGYSLIPALDRWNHRYGQLIMYLMDRNWRFPHDNEWNLNDKLELDLFNWCRKQRFMYREYNATIRGNSTTREAISCRPESITSTANLVENINDGHWKKHLSEGTWKLQDTVNCTINITLASERIEKLNKIGFLWNKRTMLWESMFTRLKEYHDKYGYPKSSSEDFRKYVKDPQLASWISKQRKAYHEYIAKTGYSGGMSQYRVDRLNSLNFSWVVTQDDNDQGNSEKHNIQQQEGSSKINSSLMNENEENDIKQQRRRIATRIKIPTKKKLRKII